MPHFLFTDFKMTSLSFKSNVIISVQQSPQVGCLQPCCVFVNVNNSIPRIWKLGMGKYNTMDGKPFALKS